MQLLNQEPSTRQSAIAVVALITLIISLAITSSVLSSLPKQQSIIEPVSKSTDPIINQFNFTTIGQALQGLITNSYDFSPKELSNLKAIIREDTIKYATNSNGKITNIQFIIDTNQPKLTYIVNDQIDIEENITISCPSIDLVQDPNVFCIDLNNKTTIDVNLSQYLPYQGSTRNRIEYYLRQEANTLISSQLIAYSNICNDEDNKQEVKSDIDFWLIQHGISNPDVIPITIKDSGCN